LLREREMRLDGCGVGAHGAGALGALLRESSSLEALDASDNRLGDAGAKVVADALRSRTSLRVLRLARNGIRAAGGEALAAMLRGNTSLRLDLRGNDLDSATESALRSAGADRVCLSATDPNVEMPWEAHRPPSAPARPSNDAEGFLAYSAGSSASTTSRPPVVSGSDADTFLQYAGGGASDRRPPSSSDAAAFLSFGGGGGGDSNRALPPAKAPPASSANDASAFLNFASGGGSPGSKPASSLSGSKNVTFGTAPTQPAAPSLGGSDANQFLAFVGNQ
jgi:hypothetical protein